MIIFSAIANSSTEKKQEKKQGETIVIDEEMDDPDLLAAVALSLQAASPPQEPKQQEPVVLKEPPPEPEQGEPASTFVVYLPGKFTFSESEFTPVDGKQITRRFKETDTLDGVFNWIRLSSENINLHQGEQKLVLTYPRKDFSAADKDKSLEELGLKGKLALRIV